MEKIGKIINVNDRDEDNYAYAICEYTMRDECIEIPRGLYNDFVRFYCPRCGKMLGLFVRGKNDNRLFSVV